MRILLIILTFFSFLGYAKSHTLEKKKNNNHHTKKQVKKNCSIFGYLIAKTLNKKPRCSEDELKIPKGEELYKVLATLSSLAEDGNIELQNIFKKEIIIAKKKKIKESCKKLEKTLKSFGNATDHFIINLLTTFSPILIQFNGGKFDMKPLVQILQKYGTMVEEKEKNYKEPTLNIKKLVWKNNINKISMIKENKELFKKDENIKKTFKINKNSYGPLNRGGQIINLARSLVPAKGFTKTEYFKNYYFEKKRKNNLTDENLKRLENEKKLDVKISGINSILKAIQINSQKLLDEDTIKNILESFSKFKVTLPNLKEKLINILKIDKKNISPEDERNIKNLHNISMIVFYRSKILNRIGLLPKEFKNKFGKLLNLKMFSFKDEKTLRGKLNSIVRGKNNNSKALVVTPLVFIESKNKYDAQYYNVLHSFENGTYLVEDSSGKRFIPSVRFKKNLLQIMKLDLKSYILNSFRELSSLINNILGEDNKKKALEEMSNFMKNNIGDTKDNCYCFLVADPKNIL